MSKSMVPLSRIEQGLASYLDAELMPQFDKNGVEKVIVGTAASLLIRKASTIVAGYKDNKVVKMLGIMDDECNIDVDTLVEEIKKNIDNDGFVIEIPVLGTLTIHKDDVDKLYGFIAEV